MAQSRNLDYLNKGVDVFSVTTQFREISLTSLGGRGVDQAAAGLGRNPALVGHQTRPTHIISPK